MKKVIMMITLMMCFVNFQTKATIYHYDNHHTTYGDSTSFDLNRDGYIDVLLYFNSIAIPTADPLSCSGSHYCGFIGNQPNQSYWRHCEINAATTAPFLIYPTTNIDSFSIWRTYGYIYNCADSINSASRFTEGFRLTEFDSTGVPTGNYTYGYINYVLINDSVRIDDWYWETHPNTFITPNYTTVGITETTSTPTISIYPNPATNQITINNNSPIYITNILGEIVYSKEIGGTINVENWNRGTYFIRTGRTSSIFILQ